MLPCEFAELVEAVHTTHSAISGSEIPQKPAFFKRSILVSFPIQAGERFTTQNIRVARPGDGLCPSRWTEILDAHATKICLLVIRLQTKILLLNKLLPIGELSNLHNLNFGGILPLW